MANKDISEFLNKLRNVEEKPEPSKKESNEDKIEFYNNRLSDDIEAAQEAGIPEDLISLYWNFFAKMSEENIGVLLVFPRLFPTILYASGDCYYLDVPVSENLLEDIFYPGTLLHDGATIIKNGKIKQSAVFFKTISNDIYTRKYGARHRVAFGVTKKSDAIAIIVSEETGKIEFIRKGELTEINSKEEFEELFKKYIKK